MRPQCPLCVRCTCLHTSCDINKMLKTTRNERMLTNYEYSIELKMLSIHIWVSARLVHCSGIVLKLCVQSSSSSTVFIVKVYYNFPNNLLNPHRVQTVTTCPYASVCLWRKKRKTYQWFDQMFHVESNILLDSHTMYKNPYNTNIYRILCIKT